MLPEGRNSMKICKYDSVFMENFKSLGEFLEVMERSEKVFKKLYDRVGELDRETQDMLHDFEFDSFYRTEGHRKARKLKAVRKERRAVKNAIELLYPLKEFARNNRKLRQDINRLIADMEKVVEEQKRRTYAPRVLKGMEINDKHFDCDFVDFMTIETT